MRLTIYRDESTLLFSQIEPVVCLYDEACDYPKETFEQITKRVVPRGFGKAKTSAAFRQEARKLFYLAR
jgi:hypothetical protein